MLLVCANFLLKCDGKTAEQLPRRRWRQHLTVLLGTCCANLRLFHHLILIKLSVGRFEYRCYALDDLGKERQCLFICDDFLVLFTHWILLRWTLQIWRGRMMQVGGVMLALVARIRLVIRWLELFDFALEVIVAGLNDVVYLLLVWIVSWLVVDQALVLEFHEDWHRALAILQRCSRNWAIRPLQRQNNLSILWRHMHILSLFNLCDVNINVTSGSVLLNPPIGKRVDAALLIPAHRTIARDDCIVLRLLMLASICKFFPCFIIITL